MTRPRTRRLYASETVRIALARKAPYEVASTLRKLRRAAQRDGDVRTAEACLLQMVVEASGTSRIRLLRKYVNETGSPFAAYLLSRYLRTRGREKAAAGVIERIRLDRGSSASEVRILATALGYKLPSTELLRAHLLRAKEDAVRERADAQFIWATTQLVALARSERRFEEGKTLCEELVTRLPSALAYQMLAIAHEDLGNHVVALNRYRKAATLAAAVGDKIAHESLKHKIRILRSSPGRSGDV